MPETALFLVQIDLRRLGLCQVFFNASRKEAAAIRKLKKYTPTKFKAGNSVYSDCRRLCCALSYKNSIIQREHGLGSL